MLELVEIFKNTYHIYYFDYAPSLVPNKYIVLFAIVCAISYVCSGYYSLYSSQTIVQDKLKQHDIFKRAK